MANLDHLYVQYQSEPNDDTLNALLSGVRIIASKSHPHFGEDIAQEVMLVVWQSLSRFIPDGKPQPMERWVKTIIRRTRANALKGKHQHISSNDLVEVAIGESMDFLDVSEVSPEMQTIASLMLSGYNFREIAEKLNMNNGTLRKRLHAYRNR